MQNIRFRKRRNHFQKRLQKEFNLLNHQVRQSLSLIKEQTLPISDQSDHMTKSAITSNNKKASNNVKKQINVDGK